MTPKHRFLALLLAVLLSATGVACGDGGTSGGGEGGGGASEQDGGGY